MIDLNHLASQQKWSAQTFGPGMRTKAIVDHIGKELYEVLDDPEDLTEWIDVIILALDGAWRCCEATNRPLTDINETLIIKQLINQSRDWPVRRSRSTLIPTRRETHDEI